MQFNNRGFKMNSAFKNIADTNTAFGNLKGCCVDNSGHITHYERLKNQAKNLYDELDELRDDGFPRKGNGELARLTLDRMGIIDALGDLVVFLYGIPHFLAVDYTEQKASKYTVDAIMSYSIENNEAYINIYDQIKALIDDLILSIEDHDDVNNIIERVSMLDSYLMSLCDVFDIDMVKAIDEITKSNMSKLCKNDEECQATLTHYRNLGVDVYSKDSPLIQDSGQPFQVVYSSCDQTVQGKVYRANKFLKCVNWCEPDLSHL